MGAVTYPQPEVANFINRNLVPLQVLSDRQPLASDFNIKWTPTIITLGSNGNEHHRTVGFLAPEELIPSLLLGIAKVHFDEDRYGEAIAFLDRLLDDHAASGPAPEAIFLLGVSSYKNSSDPAPLKDAYEKLLLKYPDSEWTKRAYPYRLL